MDITENLKMAFAALTTNKLRSGLTMLGIAIGNASVIAMVGIGEGAQKLAARQFEALGPNVLFVNITSRNIRRAIPNARPLTYEDARAIDLQVPSVAAVSPEMSSSQLITVGNKSSSSNIVGAVPAYLAVNNRGMAQGRFISDSDVRRNARVVVLGEQLARSLFPYQSPLGETIRIRNISFEVIGVMKPKGTLFESNQDERAIVPLTTMSAQIIGSNSIFGLRLSHIAVLAESRDKIKAAQFQIENLIRLRHGVSLKDYVRVFPQQAILDTAKQTNEGLTRMLASIASISLFVGGIGVMNIMLVSVTERTQEIGLRKALGAREGDILGQFIIEAVILATTGGVIGVLVGIQGLLLASSLGSLTVSISIPAILVAISVSSLIGLIFGVVPAHRAAKLDPINALRRL